jgi:hypothetical protein
MRIPVVIEPVSGGKRFRARSSEPFPATAEAESRDEALGQLTREIESQMHTREVVMLDVPTTNPLIGSLDLDDPDVQEWWEHVQEFRKRMDETRLADEPAE